MTWDLNEADARRVEAREQQLVAGAAGLRTHWDDVNTELSFLERSRRRKPGALRAQERYVRSDIPCGIDRCTTCWRTETTVAFQPRRMMAREYAEYVVPDAFSLLQCMELLEEALFGTQVQHMIVLQTVYQDALRIAPSRDATRLKNFFRDDRRVVADTIVYLFPDQHHVATATRPQRGDAFIDLDVDDSPEIEPLSVRNDRAVLQTLSWYQLHHVSSTSRLVFMVRDVDAPLSVQVAADVGCEVVTCTAFVDARFPRNGAFLQQLAFNTAEAIEWYSERRVVDEHGVALVAGEFAPHLSSAKLAELVATGQLVCGTLDVSAHNPVEAFVRVDSSSSSQRTVLDDICGAIERVFVYGRDDMNRGVHGDVVAIQLLDRAHWRTPQSDRLLVHYTGDDDSTAAAAAGGSARHKDKDASSDSDDAAAAASVKTIPTGVVVGVLQRSPRFHVATVMASTVSVGDDVGLAVPMDARIPKVRIRSQRMDALVDKRLKVVIDHWPVDSMYPSGHYVGVLGETGSLATELSALLVANEIEEAPFSEAALACLPECDIVGNCIAECSTAKRPKFCDLLDWQVPLDEVAKRRDLRTTHRVFSVDPPGCQDIDDAMSIRKLPNGNLELGVHIADVSYFVPHASPLDFEARSRATTVYLVGTRLDMLPSVLSGDLCSLHENVDRLGVSVLWELDATTLEIIDGCTWFGRTIIRSCASMTYEQAHRMLQGLNADGGKPLHDAGANAELPRGVAGAKISLELQHDIRKDLQLLTDISRKLLQTRGDQGGLDISKHEEVRFSLNIAELSDEGRGSSGGSGVEIIVKESLEIHSTIAELMIVANSYVAKHLVDVFPSSALLRRHPPPSGDRFAQLIKLAQAKDIAIDATNNYTLQQSLTAAEQSRRVDSKTMALLKSLAVRVMSQAEYICASDADATRADALRDTTSFAHYGLGLQHYTHFTSPIRRYADIIVHRQLLAAIELMGAGGSTTAAVPLQSSTGASGGPTVPAPQKLPPSQTFSVLAADDNDDDDFLDDLISSVDSKLHVASLSTPPPPPPPPPRTTTTMEPALFPPSELVPLTHNLNAKNRNAKLAARDCDELFLALYFSSHTVRAPAVITSLKQNGFIVYVPKYDIRAPVYIRDKDGLVQMDPLLCGVRIVDTQPPTGAFAAADCIRAIPQATIALDSDAERLTVTAPDASSATPPCVFKILDEVEVQISCDLSATTARVPQLQLLLVGRVKQTRSGSSQRRDATQLLHNKADASLLELQRYVHKTSQVDLRSSKQKSKDAALSASPPRDLYSLFESPMTLSPVKKSLAKSANAQRKPASGQQQQQQQQHGKGSGKTTTSVVRKRGPGRLIFGDYEPPTRQHYQQKLAHYMDTRSEALEEELNIYRRGGSSASASASELKRAERDALSRVEKLAAEKRHDKINRRSKAH